MQPILSVTVPVGKIKGAVTVTVVESLGVDRVDKTVTFDSKGLFIPSVNVSNATLTGKMGMQPILPITVSVRKIKGAAHQHYVDVTVSLDVNRPLQWIYRHSVHVMWNDDLPSWPARRPFRSPQWFCPGSWWCPGRRRARSPGWCSRSPARDTGSRSPRSSERHRNLRYSPRPSVYPSENVETYSIWKLVKVTIRVW